MMAPAAPAYGQQPPQQPTQQLDTRGEILDRLQVHEDTDQKDVVYAMRLIVANYLDITTPSSVSKPKRTDGRYGEIIKRDWEEGRSNQITTNTHIQVKSLTFHAPDLKWEDVREEVSLVRRAYVLKLWKEFGGGEVYRQKLLDMIIGGQGSVQIGTRNGKPFWEYADDLDLIYDSAYKEPHEKRFVFRAKHLPVVEAVRLFPSLTQFVRSYNPATGQGGEKTVTINCYYSRTTTAVLYGKQFLVEPKATPYAGRLSCRATILFKEPSVKHPTGVVEKQLGTHQLQLRLQRYFREVILKGVAVGIARGQFDEGDIERLEKGEEGVILRSPQANSSFEWSRGAEIQASALQLFQLFQQLQNGESGTNDFQQGRTDTKVDFASQLSLIASQGGVQGRFTAQQFEQGLKDDIGELMAIAPSIEDPYTNPITLSIKGEQFMFDPRMPIGPMLGEDGEVLLKPGGMEYKAPVQKLQEVASFANVMALAQRMPMGTQERYLRLAVTAYEVDDADQWIEDWRAAQEMAHQQAMAEQQLRAEDQANQPPAA